MTQFQILFCTCPNHETAELLANDLVNKHLAACVSILPGLTSIYHWQGQIESAQEHLLIIKSTETNYLAIEKTLTALHPYEVPEIITIPITQGLPAYLNWLQINTSSKTT